MSKYIKLDDAIGIITEHQGIRGDTFKALHNAYAVDIVRCQDCKHWVYNFNGCSRNPCTEPWYATDFCNYGERNNE